MTPRQTRHAMYSHVLNAAKTPADTREVMRRLALGDVFFLLVYVCGRKDMDRDWLFDRCMEVQASPDGRLDLWAREHYKSTIITFGMTLQDILRDPELTVCILSFNRPTAKAFLKQIKREFESNAKLKELFPDVLYANPSKESPKWSEDDGIIVRRKGNPKEATVEAYGLVDGQPTSKHYKLIVYDDVVTRESVTTPEMIGKVTEAWELSLNLESEGGRKRYIGTRYHYNDTYQTISERGSAVPRIYPAEKDGKAVFMAPDKLAEKRRDMGAYVYACQMLLNPKQDSVMGFKDTDIRYWAAQHYQGLNLYLIVDPANEKKKDSDYTVMMLIGTGADRFYYVVNVIRDRLSLTERSNRLFAWHRQYRPIEVYYEKYGMQADIAAFEDRMNRDNYRFDIVPVGGNTAKTDRIMGLLPLFENHRIWIPDSCPATNYEGVTEDLIRVFLNDEYKAFPFAPHDDMLDCLARITDPLVSMRMAFPDFVHDNLYGNNNPAILAEIAKRQQGDEHPLHFTFTR
ncbi:MAG: hypothetical protein WBK67_02820 [Minisyncoccales bacterium]